MRAKSGLFKGLNPVVTVGSLLIVLAFVILCASHGDQAAGGSADAVGQCGAPGGHGRRAVRRLYGLCRRRAGEDAVDKRQHLAGFEALRQICLQPVSVHVIFR